MKRAALLLLAILCLAPRVASATEISFLGLDKFGTVKISLTGYLNGVAVHAGQMEWQWTNTPPLGYDPSFYAYCVDVLNAETSVQDVAIRSTDLLTVSGVPDAGGKAAWLFNTYAPTVHSSGTAVDAAALQVAIWESLYDTSGDVLTGNFRVAASAGIISKSMEYLTALYSGGTGGHYSSTATWLDALGGTGQDLMVQMPAPEPASLTLLGLGVVGLVGVRRRRRGVRGRPIPTA